MGGTIALGIFLLIVGSFMALPLVYAVASSFKPATEFFLFPPPFFPKNATMANYKGLGNALSNMWVPFERYFINSVFIAVVSTVLHLIIAPLAAYPLAKHQFIGKRVLNNVITLSMMFTGTITAIPQYIVITKMNLIDSQWGVILPSLASTMGVFLCVQYMEVIPEEILESARLDGAGEFYIWWRVVMPNIKPAIMTILIFQFQGIWANSGSTVIYSENLKTLPAALSQIASAGMSRAGIGSAVAVLLMVPPLAVFIFSQSKVMETMTHSGIKG